VGEHFQSIEGRAKLVVAALVATIACDVLAMWVDVREIQLMNRIVDGDFPELSELDASDDRQALAGSLVLLTFVGTIVVYLVWFSRAYKNLTSLGATDLRYGSGWAIGAWFVPILNLWRPKQIANDIWRASDPAAPPDQEQLAFETRRGAADGLVGRLGRLSLCLEPVHARVLLGRRGRGHSQCRLWGSRVARLGHGRGRACDRGRRQDDPASVGARSERPPTPAPVIGVVDPT
jgi:Domain of unknown function (DUF4328)